MIGSLWWRPRRRRIGASAVWTRGALPPLVVTAQRPAPDEHLTRVAEVIRRIERGRLDKAVLARAVEFAAAAPVDPVRLARELARRDPAGNAFLADLSAAGGEYVGRFLVGSSPEVLVERRGAVVTCHPLAGTATRPDGLLDSDKDRAEHAYVVDAIAEVLAPLCDTLDVPPRPSLTRAGDLWHLGTVITGRLRDPGTTALDLALALHPTPAVCGIPRVAAARAIAEVEGPRGFYAGAVGWTDATGDGQWRVSIRCAEIAPDGRSLRAWAGGGIVAASDPATELAETANKLRTVLGPFDIEQWVA
ncbi:isochorismate synthase [Tsukamurella soli]|uniref:isochorismate synthase n=1 Tax=Tsukamurella soli TaxID=644556 RepID=UPI003610EDBB